MRLKNASSIIIVLSDGREIKPGGTIYVTDLFWSTAQNEEVTAGYLQSGALLTNPDPADQPVPVPPITASDVIRFADRSTTYGDFLAAARSIVDTDTTTPNNDMSLFSETPSTTRKAKRIFRSSHPGPHLTVSYSTWHIEARPIGAGVNGPSRADFAQTISVMKQGWTGNSTTAGEIDGLYIVGRNSGPDASTGVEKSDMSGILVDVQNRGQVGFANVLEASVSNIDRSNVITRSIQVQIGNVYTTPDFSEEYGFVASVNTGTIGVGFQSQDKTGNEFGKHFSARYNFVDFWNIRRSGQLALNLPNSPSGLASGELWVDDKAGNSVRRVPVGGGSVVGDSPSPHPGYVSGRWYNPERIPNTTNGLNPGAGSIRLYPAFIPQTITVTQLGTRVNTLGTGNWQAAIYAMGANNMPGALIASTGSMSTGAAGIVSSNLSGGNVVLKPGWYWFASNCDNATAILTSLTTSINISQIIGSTSQFNASGSGPAIAGIALAQTFGTWPVDLTGQTYTDATATNIPLVSMKAA